MKLVPRSIPAPLATGLALPPYLSLSYNPYIVGPLPAASSVTMWSGHCGFNYVGALEPAGLRVHGFGG